MQQIVINSSIAGQRLDKFLARYLNAAPKSFIQKMLRKKNITLNSRRVDGSVIIADGDVVTLYFSDDTIAKFTKPKNTYDGDIVVVFQDDNIAILNKPAGLLAQPDTANGDSLISRLRYHLPDAPFAPVAVNRLDRNTTGLVLCAKTLAAAQTLSKLIHDRAITKCYLAVAHGEIPRVMRLEGLHTKDADKNLAQIVPRGTILAEGKTDGKTVVTEITPIAYNAGEDVTTLKIVLETGRSHQIRAHLASVGHPLIGDKKYGGKSKGASRQMLHAFEIVFGDVEGVLEYLSGKCFVAPLPDDMVYFYNKGEGY